MKKSYGSRRITALLLALYFIFPSPSHALTVENITFADSTTIGEKPVPLRNAALLRYLKFIKAYVAALYLPEGVKAEEVLSDVPKRLELSYLVSIKGPDFDKGAAPVLERNQTPEELARLQGRIDRINAAYKDVKSGDLSAGSGNRARPERHTADGHRRSRFRRRLFWHLAGARTDR
jgi:hypothetical protein